MTMRTKLIEGTYRVMNVRTGKLRGRSYRRLEWAQAYAEHLSAIHGERHAVVKVVRKS